MPKPGRRRQPASSPPALCAGLLLLTAWLGAVLALPPAWAHDPAPPADALVHQGKPGPWGELEYSRIMIEPPDEFMPPDYTASAARWEFTGFDPVRLEDLLRNAALDATQLQGLLDPAIRTTTPTSLILRPPDDLVLHLSPESRAILYNTLARLPGNPLHQEPFRFRADLIDDWFEGSGVRTEIVTRIRQLLYRRGNSLLFSDPHLVLPALATATERVQLVKTLARKSTLLLKVRIKPDSDLESLARYWGGGRRRKDVRPLLLSLARHPGGMTIDVVHLLPRFARGLLYTYPSPDVPLVQSPDCHWTSMNFFNDPPEPRFQDITYLRESLITNYARVESAPVMGDLLLLTQPDGQVIHSCIYIADDIVFTKNGQSPSVPWTLTTLADLQAFYPAQPALLVRIFRKTP